MKKKIKVIIFIATLFCIGQVSIFAKSAYEELMDNSIDLNSLDDIGSILGETTVKCQYTNLDTGDKYYEATWDGAREIVGSLFTTHRKIAFVDTTPITVSVTGPNADAAKQSIRNECAALARQFKPPSCCNWNGDPKDGYGCRESGPCSAPTCPEPTCVTKGTTTNRTNGSVQKSKGGVSVPKIVLPNFFKEFTSYYSIKERATTGDACEDCKRLQGGSDDGCPCPHEEDPITEPDPNPAVTNYYCHADYPDKVIGLSNEEYPAVMNVSLPSYDLNFNSSKHDQLYCLQPGAKGPTASGIKYKLDKTFDISQCQDQYVNKSNVNTVQCGLAQILYFAHDCDKDGNNCKQKAEYTDGVITMAMRFWMAAYGKTNGGNQTYPSKLTDQYDDYTDDKDRDNLDEFAGELSWIPKEDFYKYTVKAIKNGKTYDTAYSLINVKNVNDVYDCSDADFNDASKRSKCKHVIHCSEKEAEQGVAPHQCKIDKAIELFHMTESVSIENYLGGINFDRAVPDLEYEEDTGIVVVQYKESRNVQHIEKVCTDVDDPDCKIEIRLFYGSDEKGYKDAIADHTYKLEKVNENFCEKNTCVAKLVRIKAYDECDEETTKTEYRLFAVIKKWNKNYGYIRLYGSAADTNKYQKMISFGINQEQCESKGLKWVNGTISTKIPVPCDCNGCKDFSGRENDNKTCNSKKTIKDAYMNCIVNACDKRDSDEFNITPKYNYLINPLVCTIYERNENEIYLPGATSVYSGMQFSYDVAKEHGITTGSTDKKTTSIVIQKKQITSKINYDYWKEEYDKKVNSLNYANRMGYSDSYKKDLKREISSWIDALRNCNFISTGNTNNSVINKLNDYVNDYKTCNSTSCISLKVNYEDEKYGKSRELARDNAFFDVEIKDSNGVSYRKYYSTTNKTITPTKSSDSIPFNIYYCKGKDCYKYEESKHDTEVEKIMPSTLSNDTIKYYNCSDSSCTSSDINIPQNDYATLVYHIQRDYYNNKNYKAKAYTGEVVEGVLTSDDKSNNSMVQLSKYIYPVGINERTKEYTINFNFNNLNNKNRFSNTPRSRIDNQSEYSNSCYYKLYNVTTAYDCAVNNNGHIEMANCHDSNYTIENNVPIINSSQIAWNETTDEKQYGFAFRSINLDDVFPGADIKKSKNNIINTRDYEINWKPEDVNEVELNADSTFVNGKCYYTNDKGKIDQKDCLEYSYTLTPQGINRIKKYNSDQKINGSYINNTLFQCELDKDGKTFKNCKSRFLEDVREYVGVTVNKDGVLK